MCEMLLAIVLLLIVVVSSVVTANKKRSRSFWLVITSAFGLLCLVSFDALRDIKM